MESKNLTCSSSSSKSGISLSDVLRGLEVRTRGEGPPDWLKRGSEAESPGRGVGLSAEEIKVED